MAPKALRISGKKKKKGFRNQIGEQMERLQTFIQKECVIHYEDSWLDTSEALQPGETRRQQK